MAEDPPAPVEPHYCDGCDLQDSQRSGQPTIPVPPAPVAQQERHYCDGCDLQESQRKVPQPAPEPPPVAKEERHYCDGCDLQEHGSPGIGDRAPSPAPNPTVMPEYLEDLLPDSQQAPEPEPAQQAPPTPIPVSVEPPAGTEILPRPDTHYCDGCDLQDHGSPGMGSAAAATPPRDDATATPDFVEELLDVPTQKTHFCDGCDLQDSQRFPEQDPTQQAPTPVPGSTPPEPIETPRRGTHYCDGCDLQVRGEPSETDPAVIAAAAGDWSDLSPEVREELGWGPGGKPRTLKPEEAVYGVWKSRCPTCNPVRPSQPAEDAPDGTILGGMGPGAAR